MRTIFFLWLAIYSTSVVKADHFAFFHENVLGTRMELRFECPTYEDAKRAEAIALNEIDRLATILSSYDPESELSRWIQRRSTSDVSPEMRQVLEASERWHRFTSGAFQPGVETLTRIWKSAERVQQLPSKETLDQAVKSLREIGWVWSSDRSEVHLRPGATVQFNAIAKGYIVDQVCNNLQTLHSMDGGMLAIGGDTRAFGSLQRWIRLQAPVDDLSAVASSRVRLHDNSIATSNGAFRGVTIAGIHYSHLLDPRSGNPASGALSASVIAKNCSDADALATACNVLSIQDSLALIDSLPDTACLLWDQHGNQYTSKRWKNFEWTPDRLTDYQEPSVAWNDGMELKIDFKIHQPEKSGRYRRPYVAVWIEGTDDTPIRTLVLWFHNTGHGQRWLPDLRRWYRADTKRLKAEQLDLVASVSEATRRPGAYSVTWNGLDDRKKLVPAGEYVLCIEAAREHGTYQLIRKKITLGTTEFQERAEDNAEIKDVSIHYRKKPKAD